MRSLCSRYRIIHSRCDFFTIDSTGRLWRRQGTSTTGRDHSHAIICLVAKWPGASGIDRVGGGRALHCVADPVLCSRSRIIHSRCDFFTIDSTRRTDFFPFLVYYGGIAQEVISIHAIPRSLAWFLYAPFSRQNAICCASGALSVHALTTCLVVIILTGSSAGTGARHVRHQSPTNKIRMLYDLSRDLTPSTTHSSSISGLSTASATHAFASTSTQRLSIRV